MSWQSFVDDQLLGAGFMYATINAFDGALWASSPGFVLAPEEAAILADALETAPGMEKIQSNGFSVAGQKYTFVRGEAADSDEIEGASYAQGRCKEEGKSSQGVLVYKTNKALVVGVHDPAYSGGSSFGKVNTDIGRLADYMMDSGH